MTKTREENALDEMHEAAVKEARVPVYVIVTGEPSDSDDHFIPGFYLVQVDSDLTDEQRAEVALDHFHDNNVIACLDDFTIRVIDVEGKWLSQMERYDNRSLMERGEYLGDFDDLSHLPEAVRAVLGEPSGPTI